MKPDSHPSRRDFLGTAAVTGLAATMLHSSPAGADESSARPKPDIAPGSLPKGKIGNVSISRLIMGGNLIGGWMHSRDLQYVSRLSMTYNTEAKIFETFDIALQCGVSAIIIDSSQVGVVAKYNSTHNPKVQMIVNYGPEADKVQTGDKVKRLADQGATLLYTHGGVTDPLVREDHIDVIAQAVELARAQGVPSGVGGHSLSVPMACEEHKVKPDFYVKTFHADNYWSATPKDHQEDYGWMRFDSNHNGFNDNMWCIDPEKTAAFMETVERPWIAFKILAAGAIPPFTAFPHAFRNGADFIAVGMFDFQVVEDTKLAIDTLKRLRNRKRAWRA